MSPKPSNTRKLVLHRETVRSLVHPSSMNPRCDQCYETIYDCSTACIIPSCVHSPCFG